MAPRKSVLPPDPWTVVPPESMDWKVPNDAVIQQKIRENERLLQKKTAKKKRKKSRPVGGGYDELWPGGPMRGVEYEVV